jgi:hypothetical protein
MGYDNDRHVNIGKRGWFYDNGAGPGADRLVDKSAPIGLLANPSDIEGARPDVAAIRGDAGDLDVEIAEALEHGCFRQKGM